ncbi:INO80 complex subunit E isoform X2 [Oncorhynchus nerka]|uniref:INO80 complex subunit E isoform X2 n=1 Tax=Salmo salar TaxID=8030 RepID=A0A1S3RW40_SALSA|nr:INO80 complex subunit E isoform X2 [Salmo salar]XP_020353487.1 INO80 complex subunit E isoform X2 [Oncorhynchus kisutch]XP_021412626.1 INO80 complex subunit E isoform X2 [Oncorhynchus mykiss]XP_024262690.1 INO80 complex subunit E isoform X2 [Oncorhynchus tshawytscha]XP_029537369.1 INO80 complex subunit E-like isoform X2 [Oncorhynchus nerka]XP_029598781.1 INO80 complex subunit E isoform X2 [Salmo trutta]XP_035602093.1 INO80 complex subunit E isoform X2 [Oncorhynchus keta]|eukprot:XP_014056493.1 PREDICTED: INO80 complex subunit E isoform X2 [Salmo salar]
MNGQADMEVDYKQKYKNLKRKLKFLVYEQECFQEELRRSQRKLLKVSRDKSFLLDRLLQYERVDEDSSDSDATASSENSEGEGTRERDGGKKRRSSPGVGLPSSSSSHLSLLSRSGVNPLQSSGSTPYLNTVVAPLAANYPAGPTAPPTSSASFNWVPRQMLSGDAAEEEGESDGDSDRGDDDRGEGEEADLVIDIPNE